jgi:molybdopterin synthase catalytic subunit
MSDQTQATYKQRILHTGCSYQNDKMWIKLTPDCLELDEVVKWCTLPSCGAVLPFIGVTRDQFEDKKVVKLSYESYIPLALSQFKEICNEVFDREGWHGVKRVALHHAVGDVGISGHSVICCVSGEHRKEVFEACEWIMFDLKKRVAIWKKECFEGGDAVWKENKEQFLTEEK